MSRKSKKLLHCCAICRKHGCKPYATPESAPVSKVKVQDVSPFTIIRVDFTGVRQCNREESKVYICLFICATSTYIILYIIRGGDRPFCANIPVSISSFCCSKVITRLVIIVIVINYRLIGNCNCN